MDVMLDNLKEVSMSGRFSEMEHFVQHGTTSCRLHTIAVAYYSYLIASRIGVTAHMRELVRGALLHDYFLYDWHMKNVCEGLHGFTHPKAALKNASLDFELSELEKKIIVRHMFPLTIVPPTSAEGWIVCLVDKICTVYEVFAAKPYYKILRYLRKNHIGV